MTGLHLGVGNDFAQTVLSGSLLLAIPVALLAGLVSFLSPCVLPLVPGYLAYVTGLVGADLADSRKTRLLAGSMLFVLGFTAVFVSFGALFGGLGSLLSQNSEVITRVLGVLTILLGLAFMMPFLLWRLLDEERLLARELPGYTDYQARVRYRLVPLLW